MKSFDSIKRAGAKEYIFAYFILSLEKNGEEGKSEFDLNEMKPCAVLASNIEQMKQKVRTHQSAFDFDTSFCKVIIKNVHEEVECVGPNNRKPMKIDKK